jgi:anti-sigma-K factor RskA
MDMSVEVGNHVIDQLPAFVLGALTDEETIQVAEHLAVCQTCQAEQSRLQLVADDLPLALTQAAPAARVKANLMRTIQAQKKERKPAADSEGWQKFLTFIRQPLPAFGAALILLLVIGNLLLWRQLITRGSLVNTPMRVVALANTQNAIGAVGTLVMDQKGDYGTLVVDKLAMLAPTQQYQVWLIKDGQRTSGGVFSVNPDGYASREIAANLPLAQYDSIGITIEPFGGSPAPTGPKVMGGEIPH